MPGAAADRLPQNNTTVDKAAKNALHAFILTLIPFCRLYTRANSITAKLTARTVIRQCRKSKAATALLVQNRPFAGFLALISLFILAISAD